MKVNKIMIANLFTTFVVILLVITMIYTRTNEGKFTLLYNCDDYDEKQKILLQMNKCEIEKGIFNNKVLCPFEKGVLEKESNFYKNYDVNYKAILIIPEYTKDFVLAVFINKGEMVKFKVSGSKVYDKEMYIVKRNAKVTISEKIGRYYNNLMNNAIDFRFIANKFVLIEPIIAHKAQVKAPKNDGIMFSSLVGQGKISDVEFDIYFENVKSSFEAVLKLVEGLQSLET